MLSQQKLSDISEILSQKEISQYLFSSQEASLHFSQKSPSPSPSIYFVKVHTITMLQTRLAAPPPCSLVHQIEVQKSNIALLSTLQCLSASGAAADPVEIEQTIAIKHVRKVVYFSKTARLYLSKHQAANVVLEWFGHVIRMAARSTLQRSRGRQQPSCPTIASRTAAATFSELFRAFQLDSLFERVRAHVYIRLSTNQRSRDGYLYDAERLAAEENALVHKCEETVRANLPENAFVDFGFAAARDVRFFLHMCRERQIEVSKASESLKVAGNVFGVEALHFSCAAKPIWICRGKEVIPEDKHPLEEDMTQSHIAKECAEIERESAAVVSSELASTAVEDEAEAKDPQKENASLKSGKKQAKPTQKPPKKQPAKKNAQKKPTKSQKSGNDSKSVVMKTPQTPAVQISSFQIETVRSGPVLPDEIDDIPELMPKTPVHTPVIQSGTAVPSSRSLTLPEESIVLMHSPQEIVQKMMHTPHNDECINETESMADEYKMSELSHCERRRIITAKASKAENVQKAKSQKKVRTKNVKKTKIEKLTEIDETQEINEKPKETEQIISQTAKTPQILPNNFEETETIDQTPTFNFSGANIEETPNEITQTPHFQNPCQIPQNILADFLRLENEKRRAIESEAVTAQLQSLFLRGTLVVRAQVRSDWGDGLRKLFKSFVAKRTQIIENAAKFSRSQTPIRTPHSHNKPSEDQVACDKTPTLLNAQNGPPQTERKTAPHFEVSRLPQVTFDPSTVVSHEMPPIDESVEIVSDRPIAPKKRPRPANEKTTGENNEMSTKCLEKPKRALTDSTSKMQRAAATREAMRPFLTKLEESIRSVNETFALLQEHIAGC